MKEIPLTQNKVALVDDEDYDRLAQFKWSAENHGHTFYASRATTINGKRIHIRMHREILGFIHGDGTLGDHKNRNGLDCRRDNLRPATKQLNGHNGNMKKANTSGYRGVSFCKQTGKWLSRIRLGGQRRNLGRYVDKITAAVAYDEAAFHHYGKDAVLNFPKGGD